MAKLSERRKRKSRSKKAAKSGNITYALGCLLIAILIPVGAVFLFFNQFSSGSSIVDNDWEKTQFESGLRASYNRDWVMKGHEFSNEDKRFDFLIETVDEEIPDNLKIRVRKPGDRDFLGEMERYEENKYRISLSSDDFEAGTVDLEGVATSDQIENKKWTSDPATINISYGLYMVWTMDWEGSPTPFSQSQINLIEDLSENHNNIPQTQFVNPRIFLDNFSSNQRDLRLDYILERQEKYGDEIGLHLHMWFDLVGAAGVEAKSEPAWDSKDGPSAKGGWDVPSSVYSYEEYKKILEWSLDTFEQNGLPEPVSFRAGGWYLDLDNVRALESTGFRVDSSGRDAQFWGQGYIPSPWSLGSTSEPYKMSTSNINDDEPGPRFDVWQLPNNGAESYRYTDEQMIQFLEDNYREEPLEERRLVVVLSHPHWFSIDYPKLERLFTRTDEIYYGDDLGPLHYSTLKEYLEILETDPNPKYTD
jgi:peptidoglycan/xylan/chitin deacetylase (PgdA/CDA1 family)